MYENLKLKTLLSLMAYDMMEEVIEFFLSEFGMKDFRNTRADCLSSGNRQKLKCVIAMLPFPELLILEAPTEGLDYFSIQNFNRLVSVFLEGGTSVIMVNVRPSELIYSAALCAFFNERELGINGRAIEIISEASSASLILKIWPRSSSDIRGKAVESRHI